MGGNTYLFTLNFYRDCAGIDAPDPNASVNIFSASCGVNTNINLRLQSVTEVSPICPRDFPRSSCNGGPLPGIEQYVYTATHTLPLQCSDWVIGYELCCRNYAITNLANPGSMNIYAEAQLNNTGGLCNNSPIFTTLPVPYFCANQTFNYNHGAIDIDGDSLVYSLVNPRTDRGTTIPHTGGYSATNPLSTNAGFNFDTQTGQMSFSATRNQQAVVTVRVDEYRNGVKIGTTIRDLQLVVLDCNNNLPTASGINGTTNFSISSCAGAQLCLNINSNDIDPGQTTTLTWSGGLPGATFTASGSPFQNGVICWTPANSDIGSHNFSIVVVDDACPIIGRNAYTFSVEVLPNPNPPIDVTPDRDICEGDCASLDELNRPAGVVYSWSPATGLSNTNIPNPVSCPQVTTLYSLSGTYPDGCSSVEQVLLTVHQPTPVSVFPKHATVCAGSSLQLNAASGAGVNFLWSTGETTASIMFTPASDTFVTVQSLNQYGCTAVDTAFITYSPPPPPQVCNNIYVTPAGTGTGLSSSDPTDLLTAISLAQCNNLTIKMAVGTYMIDNPLNISSLLTIEGGFNPSNNWDKSSLAGATAIIRSSLNPEGPPEAQRLVALYANGAVYWRLQDLTIRTADAPSTGREGMSTYGLHLTACSNYDIVRCQIIAGNASAGASGASVTGSGGAGGAGGSGGNGVDGCDNPGAGASGSPGNGGAAGGSGSDVGSGGFCCGSSRPGAAGDGAAGSPGTSYAAGDRAATPMPSGGFFTPGAQGASGGDGTGGGGGGGGGGSRGGTCACIDCAGNTGGVGGNGGDGGLGGSGGYGGGASFGVYLYNGLSGNFIDCLINSGNAGGGGDGSSGQLGASGQAGSAGATAGACVCSNPQGGDGGNGGNGGDGGRGRDGANGMNGDVYSENGVATLISGSSAQNVAAGVNAVTDFNLAGQPTIFAENVSCANRPAAFSSAGSGTWIFGADAAPPTAAGVNVNTVYSNIGRKNISYGTDSYTGFLHIAIDNATFLPDIASTAQVIGPDTFFLCSGNSADFTTTTPGVSYEWDFGGALAPAVRTTQNVTGQVFSIAGTFSITLRVQTDCCGWSVRDSVTLIVEPGATIAVAGITSLCKGETTTLTLTGATSYAMPPDYPSLAGPSATVTLSPAVTTTYTAIGYSASGTCNAQQVVAVTVYDPPTVTIAPVVDATCSNDGSATANVSGGSGTYDYVWNDQNVQTTPAASNLFSGNYEVSVTDRISGCQASAFVFIGTSGPMVYIQNTTPDTCYGGDEGTAAAAGTGGTPPYTFEWSHGPTGATVAELFAGEYTVTLSDGAGCSAIATAYISQPDSMVVVTTVLDSNFCNNDANGRVFAVADGGNGGYSYEWRRGASPGTFVTDTDTASGLVSGDYYVVATDRYGCSALNTAIIPATGPSFVLDTIVQHTLCGNVDGQITLIVSGSGGGYSYEWSHDASERDSMVNSLPAGTYVVTITDRFMCDTAMTVTLVNTDLSFTLDTILRNTTCGKADGQITLIVSGGDGSYSYEWSHDANERDSIANSMPAGTYVVRITDRLTCDTAMSVTLVNEGMSFTLDTILRHPSCPGSTDGGIIIIAGGGAGSNIFAWTPSSFGNDSIVNSIGAGDYSVNISEPSGCDTTMTITLTDPPAPTVEIVPHDTTIKEGESVHLASIYYSANSPVGLTYEWSPGETLDCDDCQNPVASPLDTAIYSLTVTDRNGCKADTFAIVNVEIVPGLWVPNAFSPNGDDINDIFYAYGKNVNTLTLLVFNRWGEKIFESHDLMTGWDGTYRGKEMNPGVYTYYLDATFLDGSKARTQKGSVTLVR